MEDLASAKSAALDNSLARGKVYNICMDEPVDYGSVASYLNKSRGLGFIEIPSSYHSTWLDNTKAKFELDWHPHFDFEKLIESAWNYKRSL